MTLTAKGFAGGPMTDDDFGAISSPMMWCGPAGDLDITQPVTGTRSARISIGKAVHHGVRVINDTAIDQALGAPGSGTQWYMLVLRRDWGTKLAPTVQALAGPATTDTGVLTSIPTTLPATFQNAPGTGQADQPLAWVQVRAATTTLVIFDLRLRRQRGQVFATSLDALRVLALMSTPLLGEELTSQADGITYRWSARAGDGVRGWLPWESEWRGFTPVVYSINGGYGASPGYISEGYYRFVGGKVEARGRFFLNGGGATVSGAQLAFDLPLAMAANSQWNDLIGRITAINASDGSSRYQLNWGVSGFTVYLGAVVVPGTQGKYGNAVGSSVPFGETWAQSDSVEFDVLYEPSNA